MSQEHSKCYTLFNPIHQIRFFIFNQQNQIKTQLNWLKIKYQIINKKISDIEILETGLEKVCRSKMLTRLLKQSAHLRRVLGKELIPNLRGNLNTEILYQPNRILHKASSLVRFNFSTKQQFTEKQFELLLQQHQINNSNPETILNSITAKINQVEDLNLAFQMAQTSSDLLLHRNEVEKGISILQTFKNKFVKEECVEALLVAAYLTDFYYLIGNIKESRRQATNLYSMHESIRPSLQDSEILAFNNIFYSTMALSDQPQFAIKYLNIAKDIIEKQQTIETSQTLLANICNFQGFQYYLLGQYQDALNSFSQFYEIEKQNIAHQVRFNFLAAQYVCNQKLSQDQKCQEILQEIEQNYGSVKDESLNKHFDFLLSQINQYKTQDAQDVIIEITQGMIKDQQDRTIIDVDQSDQAAQEFLQKKQYQEGIKLYEDLLRKLDPSKDYMRVAKVTLKLIPFYQKLEQYDRILEILLSSFNMYLNKRRQLMLDDLETYQLLVNIKDTYYLKKDYQKSIEWGRKWYSFLRINNLFIIFNKNVLRSMYIHLYSFKQLEMYEEALEFTEIIQKYIQQSPDYQESKYKLRKEKTQILLESKKPTEAIENIKQMIEEFSAQKDLNSFKQVELLDLIKSISLLYLKTGDQEGLLKYGQLYLEKTKDYEIKDDFLFYRLAISYQISLTLMEQRQYNQSEQFIRLSLDLAQRTNRFGHQFELQLMLAEISFFQDKIQEGENYLKISDDISFKCFSQSPNYQDYLDSSHQVRSFEFYQKKQFYTCLKYIESSLKKNQIDRRSVIQKQILQNLYKNNQELQDIIKKLGIIDV